MSIVHFANASMVAAPFSSLLWDGSLPVTFSQGDAVETGASTLFGIDIELAKSTKDRVIVGNRGYDTGGADIGAAHIYLKSGSSWVLEQTLQRSGAAAGDLYGNAVAISGDGTRAIVANSGNVTGQTNVEVWSRSGTTWSRIQTITTTFSVGSQTNFIEVSSDGAFLLLRNNSSFGIIEGWRWGGASYSNEFDFTEPSNTNSFAASFFISEDGKFVGVTRHAATTFIVWENTTGSTWVERTAGTGVQNSAPQDYGFGMSGDATFVSIATNGTSVINTWEWDGAAYQKVTTNLSITFPRSGRMSSSGGVIAGSIGSTANTNMYEGDGTVPYVSSGTQTPDDPEGSGISWDLSYDGKMFVVGQNSWKAANGNQGRFFSMDV